MTTLTQAPSSTTSRTAAGIGIASCLLATAAAAFGANDWAELLIVVVVLFVTTALVYGLVVPRALRKDSAGGTALGLSIPALVLLLPAFWSGLPLVLGLAGALLGGAGRHAPTGSRKCIAAIALGTLAAIGYLAIYISDGMAGGAGFLFD